ncbi:MAG: hypothetical protein HC849_21620 [Oscillatoriales cyanobacterium RU_3_3]|nr:hypothetical protein [Oscillatoriales cyanobacterium RU_3_3]
MMQNVFEQLQELQEHLEKLPSDRKAVFTKSCERLSESLHELEAEFQLLLFPDNALAKLEKLIAI